MLHIVVFSLLSQSVKIDSVGYRDGSEDGLTFAFRFTDATVSVPNQGMPKLNYC